MSLRAWHTIGIGYVPGGWFTPSSWSVSHGYEDLEAKVAAWPGFANGSARNWSPAQQQMLAMTLQDYATLGIPPGTNPQDAWNRFVTEAQHAESGDEGALGGFGSIIGGAIGTYFGSPQAGAFIGGALDRPTPPQQIRRGQSMDIKDLIRAAASGISYGENGLTYDYGTAADRLQMALTPVAAPIAMPALGGLSGLMARLGAGGIGAAAGAAMGAIRSASGRLLGFITASGRRVSRRQAVRLAREMGITAAATALGVGAAELAEAVLDETKRGRRGRGITAAQIRTTTRTIRKLERAHAQIARVARAHVGRRRAA